MGHRLIARRRKPSIIMLKVFPCSLSLTFLFFANWVSLVLIQTMYNQNNKIIPVEKCRVLGFKRLKVFSHFLCEYFAILLQKSTVI